MKFSVHECKEDWVFKTIKKGILISKTLNLTKKQTIALLTNCDHTERFRYGYSVYYYYKGERFVLSMRLSNNTTKKKYNEIQYIEMYFDTTAEFYEKVRRSELAETRKLLDEKTKEYFRNEQ